MTEPEITKWLSETRAESERIDQEHYARLCELMNQKREFFNERIAIINNEVKEEIVKLVEKMNPLVVEKELAVAEILRNIHNNNGLSRAIDFVFSSAPDGMQKYEISKQIIAVSLKYNNEREYLFNNYPERPYRLPKITTIILPPFDRN